MTSTMASAVLVFLVAWRVFYLGIAALELVAGWIAREVLGC